MKMHGRQKLSRCRAQKVPKTSYSLSKACHNEQTRRLCRMVPIVYYTKEYLRKIVLGSVA